MIVGIGVDMCAIERIERALEKARFAEKVYTEEERALLRGGTAGTWNAQRAAGFFAAKEAVMKALGTGMATPFSDIEVRKLPSGRPTLHLRGKAEERMYQLGATRAHLSISHEQGTAIAFVVLESPDARA